MIVVTGANGHLGRLVVEQLVTLVDPSRIVAGVRHPDSAADLAELGVAVRRLDYDDPASIATALGGATRVLLVSGTDFGRRVDQHQAVIDAAAAAGVDLLAYTSFLHADTSPMQLAVDHRATEAAIRASGLGFVLLRNGWYTENYTENLAPALGFGVLIGSAGEGRVAAITRADCAAAAAAVLTTDGHAGATYELAGPAFSMPELAAAVSAVTGKPINYSDLPAATHRDILASTGLPAEVVDLLLEVDHSVAAGDLVEATRDFEQLAGRPPTALDVAVRAALG